MDDAATTTGYEAAEQNMDPAVRTVVDDVRALVPSLRANARRTDEARRVLPENLGALTEAGALKLTLPRSRGGYEANVATMNEISAIIASGCPSTGWAAAVWNLGNWFAGLFPDDVADEIFATPDLRMSGVLTPTVSAIPAAGGYLVSGRWPWATGAVYSNWMTGVAMVPTDGGAVPRVVLLSADQFEYLDDWDSFGMRGTGSGTVLVDEVFVPFERTLDLADMSRGVFPERSLSEDPYFNRPNGPLFISGAAGTLLGAARGALEQFLERLPGRSIVYTDYPVQSEAPITHSQVGSAALSIRAAEHFTDDLAHLVDDYFGLEIPLHARIAARGFAGQVARHSRDAITTLYEASGASAMSLDVPIQRYLREIHGLTNHGLVQPTTATELYGRFLVGMTPNTVMF